MRHWSVLFIYVYRASEEESGVIGDKGSGRCDQSAVKVDAPERGDEDRD